MAKATLEDSIMVMWDEENVYLEVLGYGRQIVDPYEFIEKFEQAIDFIERNGGQLLTGDRVRHRVLGQSQFTETELYTTE